MGEIEDSGGRSASSGSTGLLLINVGTPSAPTTAAVRRYLGQFLMDPRVLDVPAFRRALLVHLLILPRRARRSADAYRKIWTEQGSPLLRHARELARKVEARLGGRVVAVEPAMRYGEPSIRSALDALATRGCGRVVVLPLYAHWSASATGSALAETYAAAAERWRTPALQVVPPFFDHPAYLDARAALARPSLVAQRPEKVFFTFHGVPVRQLRRERTGCLGEDSCCVPYDGENCGCYRAQCLRTAALLAERLDLPPERYQVCFQSRLGRTPWTRPYADDSLRAAASAGVRRAAILSSFVLDCLETLEELGMRAVADWRRWGGESLTLLPAPNSDPVWVDALVRILDDGLRVDAREAQAAP
ncbi:MAG TPA: ferrochelatase [Thermoanaerobaculia bacterium]|nr:ferrochelatase [Thermoanaerobaculia bacterium]